ncbi:MAG: AAA family ATPase [Thermoleophilia bacterium]|nr:AAA family ATPase [Thermoleophilia bacterium]
MAGQRRERKVVTVVFCDLVGFTARAESMDPEDVEALLGPYHERVRSELERHGGTVEKFIGDAVMALFGAPTAHEDDPERAVRAALAIREFALEEELELRVGITTGEALVRLDAQPGAGEGMASGDVVNTAARLQSAAPINGILVDETTYRATRATVAYEDAEPVEAKGKAEPVRVWTAVTAHSRFGVDVAHDARSELVGRERELGVVRDAFERARHERTPQLLTLVGVPGMGKSRLVYELSEILEADEEFITWRQGRCLAYGDGITLWALGEIVKAQAGVLEQDSPEEIAEKVHQAVEDTLLGTGDEARVETHLLALLGLAAETQLGGDRRNESFAAWRRFLEGLAEQRPLVLVVEDIHWADEILLDFIDELVDWLTDVPLLVIATARPELLERRPGWGGGKLNATTLALAPLTSDETAQLLGRVLGRPVLAADTQAALLERAGGNPLYAEQFAELYVERGSTDELPLPETLQGIIAARLDGLPGSEKSLLQDAAVVGKVFWTGGFEQDDDDVTSTLHSLERKGFVRRQRRSSLEGSGEFAFAHALVRDVAYGQIARADRAAKHRRTAEWIAALGRPEDHAEMLAYHWSSALELVRASGGDVDELVERTRLALCDAGDRAFALNSFAVASMQYDDALALWPDDDDRPELMFRLALALHWSYDEARQQRALEAARDALLAVGDTDRASETESFLARVFWDRGQHDLVREHLARAEALAGESVSAAAARVLAFSGRIREIAGERAEGRRLAEAAFAMATEFGLDELRAHALTTIGMAKNDLDDPSGIADMEHALEIALAVDSPIAGTIVNNLAVYATFAGDFPRTDELHSEALRLAERYGDASSVRFIRGNLIWGDFMLGRWDRALDSADGFIAECDAGSPHTQEGPVREVRAALFIARGDRDRALRDQLRGLELGEARHDPFQHLGSMASTAAIYAELGQLDDAHSYAAQVPPLVRELGLHGALTRLSLFADELAIGDELRAAAADWHSRPGSHSFWRQLIEHILASELEEAADMIASAGNPTIEANIRKQAGLRMLAAGRTADAQVELERALGFYRSVDASFYVEQIESALAGAQSASA